VSVPTSKAGSRLCGVRKGEAIYTVAGNGTGAGQANGKVRHKLQVLADLPHIF